MKKLLLLLSVLLAGGVSGAWAETLSYTLTDVNGEEYTGSWDGTVGTAPTFTGCAGYTLTDESWSGTTYSATINFPFPVSSNSVENQTFVGSFHNKPGYYSEDYLWHANDTKVIVHSEDIPNATSAEQDKYLWVITPSISGLNITFTIKNVSTGKYIYSTTTSNSHDNAVSLSDTASPLTYSGPLDPPPTNSTARNIYAFIVSATSMYLSVNSVNGGTDAQLGVYNIYHDGTSIGFHNYADLISRYWTRNSIATKLTMLGKVGYPAADNTYATALVTIQTSINSGSYTGNATNYGDLYTKYNGLLTAAVVTPTAGFYRIKTSVNRYAAQPYLIGENHAVSTTCAAFSESDGSTAKSIWYYDGTSLYNLGNGGYPVVRNTNDLGVSTSIPYSAANVAFEKAKTGEFGAMWIKLFNETRYLYATTSNNQYKTYTANGSGTTDNGYSFNLEPVTSLPVTITSVGYATLYSPVALTIPTGVTAYKAADNGTYLTLTAIGTGSGTIPANTGVILAADAGTYNFDITTGGSVDSNALTGTVEAISRPENSYILATGSAGVGFYKDGSPTIPGFKAYLPAGVGGSVKGFRFTGEDAIMETKAEKKVFKGTVYDLSGNPVPNPKRGIYVMDGETIFIP